MTARSLLVVAAFLFAYPSLGQGKLPIPDETAQDKALAVVKEVYKADYEAARTNEQKAVLAKKLLQDSASTKDATNRYVLLRVAKDIAAQAGDVDTALAVISKMSAEFEVDGLMMRAAVVANASKEFRLPKEHQLLAPYFLRLMEEAVAADRYELADNIGTAALASARKARDSDIVKQVIKAKNRAKEIEATFVEVQAALDVLKEKPTDADANLVVGRFRCFVKDDWDAGVTNLALGCDEKMKALAAKELADEPDALGLGDGWWDTSEELDGSAEDAARRRAAYWYAEALPGLDGLVKRKVEGRLVQSAAVDQPMAIFNGETLDGWQDDAGHWSVDNGVIQSGGKSRLTSNKSLHAPFYLACEIEVGELRQYSLGFVDKNGKVIQIDFGYADRIRINGDFVRFPFRTGVWNSVKCEFTEKEVLISVGSLTVKRVVLPRQFPLTPYLYAEGKQGRYRNITLGSR